MSKHDTILAGVVGWPVRHSLSPLLHGYWIKQYGLSAAYVPLPVKPEKFGQAMAALPALGFSGVSVTVPHKQAAYALCARLDADARAIGAVNTLYFEEGVPCGINTDVLGFLDNLTGTLGENAVHGKTCTILGAGGAARAVTAALIRAGASEIRLVNRTASRAKGIAALFSGAITLSVEEWGAWEKSLSGAALLVNTTSLGMNGQPPLEIALDSLNKSAAVADIVYNPLVTDLLARAAKRGHPTVEGLGMLLHQACPAFTRWFGITPEVTPQLRAVLESRLKP